MTDAGVGWVAARYGLAEARVVERRGAITRLATASGEVAVKRFAEEDGDRARREAELLAHLAAPDARYRVQALVRTTAGELVATGDAGVVVVTRWEPGHAKPYTEIAPREWHALGGALAALHRRLDTFAAPLPRLSARLASRDLADERAGHDLNAARTAALEPDRAAELGLYLDAQRALIDAHGERARALPDADERPIHDDFNQHNYLFDGREPPIILDWEGAIAAPREYEIVRCLNHLPLALPAHASAFIAGYRIAGGALDRELVRWAIDVVLVEHAVKRWPLEQWLAGDASAAPRLTGSMAILHALADGTAALEAFYERETR
jgi:Ser/Thr protein kinase RdoA (MazF antagonist)